MSALIVYVVIEVIDMRKHISVLAAGVLLLTGCSDGSEYNEKVRSGMWRDVSGMYYWFNEDGTGSRYNTEKGTGGEFTYSLGEGTSLEYVEGVGFAEVEVMQLTLTTDGGVTIVFEVNDMDKDTIVLDWEGIVIDLKYVSASEREYKKITEIKPEPYTGWTIKSGRWELEDEGVAYFDAETLTGTMYESSGKEYQFTYEYREKDGYVLFSMKEERNGEYYVTERYAEKVSDDEVILHWDIDRWDNDELNQTLRYVSDEQ